MYKNSRLRDGALMLVRAIALLLMAWYLLLPLQANATDPAWQGVWSGTLGKQPIVACLDSRGRSAYYYARSQREIPLTEKDDAWDEYNQGELSGIWTLSKVPGDQLAGQWQNPKSQRTLPIDLKKSTRTESDHPCDSMAYRSELSGSASLANLSATGVSGNITHASVARALLPEYAYVANSRLDANLEIGSVSTYRINATTGVLTEVQDGSVEAGIDPSCVTVNSIGTFAYVTNQGSNNISVYRINAATGALTPVPGSPFATGIEPLSATVNPSGTFIYVVNKGSDNGSINGSVTAYRINAATGALTPVPGSPFATGIEPLSATVNPSGTFIYVVNKGSDNGLINGSVTAYRINATTGALTPIPGSPFAARDLPGSITINPSGTFIYVANYSTVTAYRIDTTTGALTSVAGSPFGVGNDFWFVTVNPASTFAYVTSYGDDTVTVYRINAITGALTEVSGSPFAVGNNPSSVTVNSAATFAYVVNDADQYGNGSVSTYHINATTGALTPVPGGSVMIEDSAGYLTLAHIGVLSH